MITSGPEKKTLTLKVKLTILFLFVASIFISAFAIITIRSIGLDFRAEIMSNITANSKLTISEISLWSARNESSIFQISDYNSTIAQSLLLFKKTGNEDDLAELRNNLERALIHSASFTSLSILDPETAIVIASTNPAIEEKLSQLRKDETEGGNQRFVSSIEYSDQSKMHVMSIHQPIKDPLGETYGMLKAEVNVLSVSEVLYRQGDLQSGKAYLVDNTGRPIAGLKEAGRSSIPDYSLKLSSLGIKKALEKQSGIEEYEDFRGDPVVGYYEFLPSLNAAFVYEFATREVYEGLFRMKRNIALVGAIVFMIAGIIAYLLIDRLTGPIRSLTETAKRISEGKYNQRATIQSQDEVGTLSTAFNQMTDSLVSSLEDIKNIMNTVPNPLWVLDRKGSITELNPAAIEFSGFKKSALIGMNLADLLYPTKSGKKSHKQKKSDTPIDLIKLIKGDEIINLEALFYQKNKRKSLINVSGRAIHNEKKQIIGYVVITKDLRELKKYARERVDEILPYLHKISLGDFTEKVHLPEREDEFSDLIGAISLMSSNLEELIEENETKTAEIQSQADELRKNQGEIILKNTLLQSQYDASKDGILAVNNEGKVMSFNKSFSKIWNLTPDEFTKGETETISKHIYSHLKDKESTLKAMEYLEKHPKASTESRMELKNGKIYLTQSAPLITREGKILGRAYYFRDITKESKIEEAKSEFVSLASHQLQTPLTAIKWLMELLLERKLDKDSKEIVEETLESNERMVLLVNDFLNVSRLEMGSVAPKSTKTDIGHFVQKLIHDVRFLADKKGIKIILKKPDKSLTISLDQNLIGEVILNLMTNALRYSDRNTEVIIQIEKRGRGVEIAVKDEGIGISEEEMEKIGTKFYRTAQAARHATNGSGLGLYISQKILEICKGKMEIHSKPGKGSVFSIILPINGPVSKNKDSKTIIKQMLSQHLLINK